MGNLSNFLKDPVKGLPVAVPHSDGHWISEKVSRIVECIRDYDPRIDVEWIPPENLKDPNDPQFRLVECLPDGRRETMFYVQDEADFNGAVLERVYEMDAAKHGNVLNKIEARNKAVRALQENIFREEMEAAHDLAQHILKSPKTRYKHDGVVYE